MRRTFPITLVSLTCLAFAAAPASRRAVQNFEKVAAGSFPEEEMMLLMGKGVVVAQEEGNRFLRFPGDPMDVYGALAEPEKSQSDSIRARVRANATGKRTPEFAVGIGGAGGCLLWVVPAVGQIQLVRPDQDEPLATAPYVWTNGQWTQLTLQVQPLDGGKARILGKAWAQGRSEPEKWMVQFDVDEKPAGRASIWCKPFSEKPIDFDDIETR